MALLFTRIIDPLYSNTIECQTSSYHIFEYNHFQVLVYIPQPTTFSFQSTRDLMLRLALSIHTKINRVNDNTDMSLI